MNLPSANRQLHVRENVTSAKRENVMSVKVSVVTHKKVVQLHKFLKYSAAKRAWGKDQKLLKCNLLLVPTATNYTVLLALGRRSRSGI